MSLDQCNNDLSQHLSRCHLSQERITEGGLILARSGLFYTTEAQRGEMFVCPKHRAYLGQYWGNQTKSRSCKYPEHKGERKAARTNRAFTLRVSREVMEMFGFLVPVGAREYLPLNSSINFYLKELRLMNNLGYIHTVPDEFSTGSKIDRLLCSHGTVQYFCSVQTELTYWMKF